MAPTLGLLVLVYTGEIRGSLAFAVIAMSAWLGWHSLRAECLPSLHASNMAQRRR